jgi:hypothetical protein
MSDDDLTDYFAAAVEFWKRGPEARLLLQLRAVHRQACRHRKHWYAFTGQG